jgi:hypothetical protein
LLNSKDNGFATSFLTAINILLLIISGPTALLIFNSLLYKFQSGFIPGYSTTHQLAELYHNILLALDNKEMTSITFADVSKEERYWSII